MQTNLQPTLRVQVRDDLENIKTYVSQISGVKIVKSNPDLIITKDGEDIVLALPNFHPLCRFTTFELQQIADRIQRHLHIAPLISLTYPHQGFNVAIEIVGPNQKSIIRQDESFGFEIYSEESAYVLLINVDPAGAVHVLYPHDKSELQPLGPGERRILPGRFRALWPYGTETLKLFAFARMPQEIETIMGKEDIHPSMPWFRTIEQIVGFGSKASKRALVRQDAAQAVLKITSYSKNDIRRQ